MPPRSPLPPRLIGRPFTVAEAAALGITPGRLRGADLLVPFRGVRLATGSPVDFRQRCLALQARLPGGAFFSHQTAARLMSMPLPLSVENDRALHIAVVSPLRAAGPAGTVRHQLQAAPSARLWGNLRIASPEHTWCLLAENLSVPDLVAVGDFMLTGNPPLARLDELAASVRAHRGRRGAAKLTAALALVRRGPLSRPETHARLIFTAAGLIEPELNGNIYDARGRFVAMSDFVWRAARVAWEYEGDHHWGDKHQFRKDVLRRERVEDIGWRLTRFTADDLTLRTEETVTRLALKLNVTVSAAAMRRAIAVRRQIAV